MPKFRHWSSVLERRRLRTRTPAGSANKLRSSLRRANGILKIILKVAIKTPISCQAILVERKFLKIKMLLFDQKVVLNLRFGFCGERETDDLAK